MGVMCIDARYGILCRTKTKTFWTIAFMPIPLTFIYSLSSFRFFVMCAKELTCTHMKIVLKEKTVFLT